MTRPSPPVLRLLFPLAAVLLVLPAAAQVDLPKGARRKEAVENARPGIELSRRPQNQVPKTPDAGLGHDVDLPAGAAAPPQGRPAGQAEGGEPDPAGAAAVEAPLASAARAVFQRLSAARGLDPAVLDEALVALEPLGPAAVPPARVALASDGGAALLVAARFLLAHGMPDDRAAVVARVDQRLPDGVGERLVRDVANADPVVVDPGVLVSWLDHESGEVRRAVTRLVRDRVDASWVPFLAEGLASERTDTRARLLDLLGSVHAPAATNVLVDRLADPAGKVAHRAVQLLALDTDPSLDERLLRMAFDDPSARLGYDRVAAYALLAIVEREDRERRAILDGSRVPQLFEVLSSPDELSVGAAACALAGIGFRSGAEDTSWLDLEVPHFLVRVVSGAVFHTDFASLREPAERRLELLTGLAYGNQGPLWQEWWTRVAGSFVARRSVLAVAADEVDRLRVTLLPRPGEEPIVLVGPLVADAELAGLEGEPLFLRSDEMRELDGLLRREDVYGPKLVPAPQEDGEPQQAYLDVRLEKRGKRIVPAPGAVWFARTVELARALAEANRWQLFPDPRRHASRRELFLAEGDWWLGEHTPAERARRLRELLLDHCEGTSPEPTMAALQLLSELPDAAAPQDFPRLLGLVRDLRFPGDSLALLVDLALDAAPRTADGEHVEPELARSLVDVLLARFRGAGRPAARDVLAAAPLELTLEAARAQDPLRREVGAGALATCRDPGARTELLSLLGDPAETVRAEAVRSLGPWLDEEVARRLIVLAREGTARERVAAFEVLAGYPGKEVTDLLVVALADRDLEVVRAACRALAERRDAASVPVLAALFARGTSGPVFPEVRHALENLGPAASSELLRLTVTGSLEVQREAAVLLARLGEPAAVPVLLTLLTLDPTDLRVSNELAVLSCADFRSRPDAVDAWWEWWDLVVHDDSLPWLLAAAHLRGVPMPPEGAWARENGPDPDARVREFLVDTALLDGAVGERARRELALRYGLEVEAPPADADARQRWRDALLGTDGGEDDEPGR